MSPQGYSNYELELAVGPVEAGTFRVLRAFLLEECSRPFLARVDVRSDDIRFNAAALLREPATLVVYSQGSGKVVRWLHAIVESVHDEVDRSEMAQRISFELVPALSFLCYTKDSRLYQEMTVRDIVHQVLTEHGLPAESIAWRLEQSYSPREITTQYDETCLDFVLRLLEEEGICFFYEHDESGTRLVLTDAPSGFSKHPGGGVPYRAEAGLLSEEAITELAQFDSLRPGKLTLRDHDFKKPSILLEAIETESVPFNRELYEYPGRFVDPPVGKRYAKVRLAEQRALGSGVRGSGHVFAMTPGHVFTLEDSPDPSLNGDYLPQVVEHAFAQTAQGAVRYQTRFLLQPADCPYCPERRTPAPVVSSPTLAMVSGPPGEEIHCDEYGRVKVQYLWDRYGKNDDKSSSWVRVTQMQSTGSCAIPRIGWEVLVECEDGNPDKPVIVGRLYNNVQPPPAQLPAQKTVTALKSFSSPGGGGHNEIQIDDAAGSELVSAHAQKDMNLVVANNRTSHVTNCTSVGVGANQTLEVGAMRMEDVGENDEIKVDTNQSWTVGAVRTETVSGDEGVSIKGKRDVTIGATHMTLTPQAISIDTAGTFTETIGGMALEASALETSMAVAGSLSVTVGGAKLEAVASGLTESTVGARAVTVGGAHISAAGKDVSVSSNAGKSSTVGGVYLGSGGGNAELSAKGALDIKIGAALAINGATVVFKVGGSNVTIAGGSVVLSSKQIVLNATGPHAELAPIVGSK